eukprot:gene19468-biopygen963
MKNCPLLLEGSQLSEVSIFGREPVSVVFFVLGTSDQPAAARTPARTAAPLHPRAPPYGFRGCCGGGAPRRAGRAGLQGTLFSRKDPVTTLTRCGLPCLEKMAPAAACRASSSWTGPRCGPYLLFPLGVYPLLFGGI